MLSATDLVEAGNKWRFANGESEFLLRHWLSNKSTQEFMSEIEKSEGVVPIKTKRGKYGGTWMHPLLFIDLALAISPKLKLEAYKWLHDELLKHRNNSGESYKRMTGALYDRFGDKFRFNRYIPTVAMRIQDACGVSDWQHATSEQLEMRDKIHNNIALLTSVLRDCDKAVEYGIKEVLTPTSS